ncbi:Acid phosphatase protein [Dioscorea alata]|uniref:Acid phosphatase protein n=1 Tax=Dioscorea alata TaxID=55571 RepID=A0ACB7U9T0_DIOAL|nr:Acid phosphatase protein [Dioscorea alata]
MSTYPDPMEPADSNHSLLSDRRSELGSRYVVESGVYMSAFAATVFIAALVTIGVLLLTLLVALTVMLENCQSRNSGVIEQVKASGENGYCRVFAFHAELNNLEADKFPPTCLAHAFEYIEEGQFLQDLKLTVQVAESYFSTMKPDGDGSGVILVDADDVLLPDINNTGSPGQNRIKRVDDVENQARSLVLELHLKLQTHGWILIPFSRRHMKHYNATIASLSSVGFGGHSSLIMRSDDEVAMENWKFISERRVRLHNQGVHISSVISSQMDALTGPCLGQRNFKLAHPIHHRTEQPHNL